MSKVTSRSQSHLGTSIEVTCNHIVGQATSLALLTLYNIPFNLSVQIMITMLILSTLVNYCVRRAAVLLARGSPQSCSHTGIEICLSFFLVSTLSFLVLATAGQTIEQSSPIVQWMLVLGLLRKYLLRRFFDYMTFR